jgi:hypothetical protein
MDSPLRLEEPLTPNGEETFQDRSSSTDLEVSYDKLLRREVPDSLLRTLLQ